VRTWGWSWEILDLKDFEIRKALLARKYGVHIYLTSGECSSAPESFQLPESSFSSWTPRLSNLFFNLSFPLYPLLLVSGSCLVQTSTEAIEELLEEI
jgi:hypothetical protein